MRKIAVFTSGGDAPGMNACIRAVVRGAIYYEAKIYGINQGYQGLIENDFFEMNSYSVSNILQHGGTMLKSARSKDFMTKEGRQKAYDNLVERGITGLVAIGGDGTLLEAERRFPGIPKLPVKDSRMCDKCEINLFDNFLDLIIEEKYYIESINKLECYFNGKKTLFLATNDIIIRNTEITQAIRFDLFTNKKKVGSYIGDGIVTSTIHGATAYFQTITKKIFKKGVGLTINNVKDEQNYFLLSTNPQIKFIIKRGKAQIGCDNYRQKIRIKPQDEVIIRVSKQKVNIIKFK